METNLSDALGVGDSHGDFAPEFEGLRDQVAKLLTKLRKAGVAAFISGAGPTVLVLHTGGSAEVEELTRAGGEKFSAMALGVSRSGASLI